MMKLSLSGLSFFDSSPGAGRAKKVKNRRTAGHAQVQFIFPRLH
jgi:hypothetical protein